MKGIFFILSAQTWSTNVALSYHIMNKVRAFDCHAMFLLIFHLPARKSDATAKF